jgi:hypothetical protein
VVLSCGKRSEQLKTQLAVCRRKQNPAGAGLGNSPMDFPVCLRGFAAGFTGFLYAYILFFLHGVKRLFKIRCKGRGDFSTDYQSIGAMREYGRCNTETGDKSAKNAPVFMPYFARKLRPHG